MNDEKDETKEETRQETAEQQLCQATTPRGISQGARSETLGLESWGGEVVIISRDELELEIVLQEYKYDGIKRLVLHIDPTKSIPMHPNGYDGLTLIKLSPNDTKSFWPNDRFPFILYWSAGHSQPCRTWEHGLEMFERIKTRMLERITKEARS